MISWVVGFGNVRPKGALAVFFEVVYTSTDWALRPIDRLLPPVRLGNVAFGLGLLVLSIAVVILRQVALSL